jgi:hypothetical protein
MFHIYNKFDLRFLGKAGTKGQAPFEFLNPYIYKTSTTTDEKDCIEFYDSHLMQSKKVDFKKILVGERIANCVVSEKLDNKLMFCHEFLILDKNRIAGLSIDESKGLFFIYDKEKKWVDFHPHPKRNLEERYYMQVYYAQLGANSSKGVIVYAAMCYDEILFFDLSGNLKKKYYFSELIQPELATQFTGVSLDANMYSVKTYGTSEKFYVLKVNQSQNQIENPILPVQILSFDWDGNLIDVYQLDFIPKTFCVDEETQTIFLIQNNNVESDFTVNIIKSSL